MKDIIWTHGRKTSKEKICELEELWNVKLPAAYVSVILENDGAHGDMVNKEGELKPVAINCEKIGEIGFVLLKTDNNKGIMHSRIVFVWKAFMETLPEPNKIFPFAESGGNMIYFDYRKSAENPSILYQDHERAISKDDLADYQLEERPLGEWLNESLVPIADSFEDLMDRFYPSDW